MAVGAARLTGDRQHGVDRADGRGALLGLDAYQRVGVLTTVVVIGRERNARRLVPVHVRRHITEREVDEERLITIVLVDRLRVVEEVRDSQTWHGVLYRSETLVAAVDQTVGTDVKLFGIRNRQTDVMRDRERSGEQRRDD